MTVLAFISVLSALAAVVGVMVVLGHLLGRARSLPGACPSAGAIEVVSRVGLAPKQGVATLRVGERLLVVSWGEGGVRTLDRFDDAFRDESGTGAKEPMTLPAARPVRYAIPGSSSVGMPHVAHMLRAGGRLCTVLTLRVLARLRALPERHDLSRGQAFRLLVTARRRVVASVRRSIASVRTALPLVLCLAWVAGLPPTLHGQAAAGVPVPAAPPGAVAPVGQEATVQRPDGSVFAGPQMRLSLGGEEEEERMELSGPVGTVLFIGFMTLIPTLLLLMTSFTRILIVLHLLKQALGTQTAPPAHLLAAIALLLTGFVMAPTFEQIQVAAVEPWMAGETDELEMLATAAVPMREFMLLNTREQDLASFTELQGGSLPETVDDIPLVVVTSAFVTSELTSAFQMGFALFLPFVVLDIVVASVLMSMGMFMLPPVMVSLPFKLLMFVLVDGWSLVMTSLVRSF